MREAVLIAILLLGACNGERRRICGNLPRRVTELGIPKTLGERRDFAASCVEHWAARLAKSKQDSASDVAKAATVACSGAIMQAATPNEDRSYWFDRAHFIAVQTRAGDCYPDA